MIDDNNIFNKDGFFYFYIINKLINILLKENILKIFWTILEKFGRDWLEFIFIFIIIIGIQLLN